MRAVVVEELTGPQAATLVEIPEPHGAHPRADGQRLLVDVHAAGLSFIDRCRPGANTRTVCRLRTCVAASTQVSSSRRRKARTSDRATGSGESSGTVPSPTVRWHCPSTR